MKKLIAMLGAVAMAFGLYAADYKLSFEETEAGVDTGTWTVPDTGSPWAPAGTYTLATDGASRALPYSTTPGDPMARRAFDAGTNDNYLPLETGSNELSLSIDEGNMVIDQLVKFTGFEDPQTNLVAGTKIAVWMSEIPDEDDEDVTHTNLYVTCAKVTDEGTEQVAIQIGDEGDYELDTWYRLTIKSLGNIMTAGTRAGFVVYVNGQLLKSDEAKTLIGTDDLTADAAKALAKGALFPAIDATDAVFASASFKGIGAIDDVYVDVTGPQFKDEIDCTILPTENVVITIVDKDGNPITVTDGMFSVDPAVAPLTVTFKAAKGYVMDDVVKQITAAQLAENPDFDFSDEVEPQEEVCTVSVDGAKAVGYASFEDGFAAIAAAQEQGVKDFDVEIKQAGSAFDGAYTFAAGVGITIGEWTDGDEEEPTVLGSQWDIFNGNVTCTTGVENRKFVNFDSGEEDVYTLTLGGTVKPGAVVKAAAFAAGANLAFEVNEEEGTPKIITKATGLEDVITAPTGYEIVASDPDEDDFITYTAVQSAPTTWTIDVPAPVTHTELFVTAGKEELGTTGGVYTISAEISEVSVRYAIADNGYDWADPSAEKTWTVTKGEQVAITAPTVVAIEYTITYIYKGTPLENLTPATYTVVSGATLPVKGDVTLPESMEFEGWYDNDAFTGDAVTAIAVGSIGNTNFYAKAKALAPDWPDDPTEDRGKDAKETFPNLPATFAGADAGLVAAWAKDPNKGNLAYGEMAGANIDAFLLDCSAANVTTEMAKFKIVSITSDGAGGWTIKVVDEVTGEGSTYGNGKIQLLGKTAIDAKEEWHQKIGTDTVFKAKLAPYVIGK